MGIAAAAEIDADVPDLDAFIAKYADSFARGHSNRSEERLMELESFDEIEDQLNSWETERSEGITNRETVQLAEAIAATVFLTAGHSLVWQTGMKPCPLCQKMQGRKVGGGQSFANPGDIIDPGDGETLPLTIHRGVGHPQLHGGCVCYVVAG